MMTDRPASAAIWTSPSRKRAVGMPAKGESLHALKRGLLYAHEGAVRARHLQEQTEQAWCLTLVTKVAEAILAILPDLWTASTADTCECAEANNWRGGRLRTWTVPMAEYWAPSHAHIFTIGIAKQRTLATARSSDDTQARDLTSAQGPRRGTYGAAAGFRSRGRTSHRWPPKRMTRPHPLGRAHR